MNIFAVFMKTLKENLRDWKILILTIAFTPFFVFLMYLFYGSSTVQYSVLVYNTDAGVILNNNTTINEGKDLVGEIRKAENADGAKMFKVNEIDNVENGKKQIKEVKADIFVVIPKDFSKVINQYSHGKGIKKADIKLYGNMTNSRYLMVAVLIDGYISKYISFAANIESPVSYVEEFLEKSRIKRDFDLYVPGLIVLSVIMVLFTACASIIKEVDKGTIIRLRISKLSTFEFLSGISIVQILITIISMLITLVTAVILGFSPAGSILVLIFIGILACISVMSISLIVSSFLKSIFDLMTIGCFPFFILMFFSGGMFPMPQFKLFDIGNHAVNLTDILPTSHAISAMNKVLNFGAGLNDVVFEIAAIIILSVLYFAVGSVMFKRRYMRGV